MTTSAAVLHLTLANFRAGLAESEVEAVIDAFGSLGSLSGVLHLGAVRSVADESTYALALFAYLRDRASLEAFGTDGRHMDFLRRSLVGSVSAVATAEVAVSVLPPPAYACAVCFGAGFRSRTFDWQVRELLEGLAGPLVVSGGPAIDSGQRFRAAGLAFAAGGAEASRSSFAEFKRRWQEAWVPVISESALVLGEARALAVPAIAKEGGS